MRGFVVEPDNAWRSVAMATWRSQSEASIYGWIDVDVSQLLPHLARLRQAGSAVTLTHAVGKAVALAFAESPSANAVVSRGRVLRRRSVDVFFSVATNGGKGLAGQKLRNVEALSLSQVAAELQRGVRTIRERGDTPMQRSQKLLGKLPKSLIAPLLHGIGALSFDLGLDLERVGVPTDPFGTAIVTNVGTLGIEQGFGPLMEHGRTAALFTVGQARDKVVAVDGKPEVRPVVTLGATFDHRVVDGYALGKISGRVRAALESPVSAFAESELTISDRAPPI